GGGDRVTAFRDEGDADRFLPDEVAGGFDGAEGGRPVLEDLRFRIGDGAGEGENVGSLALEFQGGIDERHGFLGLLSVVRDRGRDGEVGAMHGRVFQRDDVGLVENEIYVKVRGGEKSDGACIHFADESEDGGEVGPGKAVIGGAGVVLPYAEWLVSI